MNAPMNCLYLMSTPPLHRRESGKEGVNDGGEDLDINLKKQFKQISTPLERVPPYKVENVPYLGSKTNLLCRRSAALSDSLK